ncbi:MAG: proton-translocating transhydrogenase family protein [Planctomycetota bacterium]
MTMILILILAAALGIELIRRIPSQLHTPLMSGSNAISGITIVAAIAAAHAENSMVSTTLAAIAVAAAAANVVGGYLVTDRMLGMFNAGASGKGASK